MKLIFKQLFGFGVVGVICFVIDYGLMIFMTEIFDINYLISCGISFTISTIVNYVLSMRFVFVSKDNMRKSVEFLLFVTLSISGLVLTELLMLLSVDKLHIHYMISKIIVTGIVMIYNFVTRKVLLDKGNE